MKTSRATAKTKMKKIVKKRLIFLLIITLALVSLVLFFVSSTRYKPEPMEFVKYMEYYNHSDLFYNYEVTRYPSNVSISPAGLDDDRLSLGVVVDPWNLNFGIVPFGNNTGARVIELTNMRDKPTRIYIEVYGNLTPHVEFTKNNFILNPKENIEIDAVFEAGGAAIGDYSGEIDVIAQKPKYSFIYMIWR